MNSFMRRITALGRPLDPAWATNRAVLVLIPVGGLVAFGRAALLGGFASPLVVGLVGCAVVLLTWALGRELAPDPQGAAFVSLALGFGVYLVDPTVSVLLAGTGLVLARVVNRTTGLPATPLDTLALLALAAWAVAEGNGPGPALAAALAFGLDAGLPSDRPGGGARQGAAALVAGVGALWAALGPSAPLVAAPPPGWALPSLPGLVAVSVLVAAALRLVLATTRVTSRGDDTGEPLVAARVRGGIVVVTVLGLGACLQGDAGLRGSGLVWACLAGVALWRPGRDAT